MDLLFDIGETYGIWGIIGVIVCMIMFLLIKWVSKKMFNDVSSGLEKIGENLTEQLSKQNESLTKVIIEQQDKLFNHLLDEKKNEVKRHNNMVNDKEDLAVDINNSLRDIMNIHNSQRAYILVFHNHNENLSGVPFVKFSCKYEWFEQGYDPLFATCKDMAFGSIAQIVQDVRRSDMQCVIYTDLEKFRAENPSIYHYIKSDQSKAFVFKAMYDKNNLLISLLVLEYNYDIDPSKINLNKISVQAAELTQLLNLRYKYTN